MAHLGLFWQAQKQDKHEALKPGFFDLSHRIDWGIFDATLQKGLGRDQKIPSKGGRPPFSHLMMFKILVLQKMHELSDDAMEFQLHDRLSFRQFVGLKETESIPDAKTIWLFREQLSQNGVIENLFKRLHIHLEQLGLKACGGQIVDASIQEVRIPRSRDDTAYKTPASKAQHDRDASFTKKNNKSFFGYKNHANIDKKHRMVRSFEVTTSSTHDSQVLEHVVTRHNTSALYADSAYRGGKCDEVTEKMFENDKRQHRAYRNKPLTGPQKRANRARSKVRVVVEHVFAPLKNWGKVLSIRSIGLTRARGTIALFNLIHNMKRLMFLNKKRDLEEFCA